MPLRCVKAEVDVEAYSVSFHAIFQDFMWVVQNVPNELKKTTKVSESQQQISVTMLQTL